jgi:hypothetical protein
MRRRAPAVVGLDQADLVLVAAQVRGVDPDEVLASADVGVLSGIAARVRTIPSVAAAAAEVLVGVAAGRPFSGSDSAVAWLAAVVLVERNGFTLVGNDDEWVRVVRAAAVGDVGEREVTEVLNAALQPRAGWVRKVVTAAWTPRAVTLPEQHSCPACGADVDRAALWLFPAWAVPSDFELASACARLRGTHDRAGVAIPPRASAAPERWCPVLLGPVEGGRVPFVALTDRGPLAFRPAADDDGFDLVDAGAVDPTELVGSWASLWARGHVIAHLPPTACRFDVDRTRLDWCRVVDAIPSIELVSA